MKNQPTDIPSYIRSVRKKMGLTQMQFAAAIEVSFPTVNRWENGRVIPLPLAMKAIRELERTGNIVKPDKVEFKETVNNREYEAIFRNKIIYTIQRSQRHGDIWVARYIRSKRIVDKDQYRWDLFERLQIRASKRTK